MVLCCLGPFGKPVCDFTTFCLERQAYTLVYDYSEALSLARLSKTPIARTLAQLKGAGVASVAISQYTAEEASRQGKLLIWDGTAIVSGGTVPGRLQNITPKEGRLYIIPQDQAVEEDLAALLPDLGGEVLINSKSCATADESCFIQKTAPGAPSREDPTGEEKGPWNCDQAENDRFWI